MKLRAQIKLTTGTINKEKGIIEGVAVVTQGAAKGHGMLIDQETTASVLRAVKAYSSGVKVKFNPNTFNHGDGAIVGLLPKDSFKMDGDVLRADLHLEEAYSERDYILNLIEKQGDTFGLSIDFDCTAENINGIDFARCTELYAATIVDQPAANPSGFWSIEDNKQTRTTKEEMNKEEFAAMLTEALKPTATAIGELKSDVATIRNEVNAFKADNAPIVLSEVTAGELAAADVEEKDSDETKMAKIRQYRQDKGKTVSMADVKKTVLSFVREVGGNPAKASANSGGDGSGDATLKGKAGATFQAKVEELMVTGNLKRQQATLLAVRNFPGLHKAAIEEAGVKPKAA
jgi:hypothetical protein